MNKPMILYIVLLSSLIASISTTLIYGSPQFPDTWIQLRIAKDALSTGYLRVWDSYDTNWPLVNIILSMLSYVTGLDPRLTIYLVLVAITGLSIIPLYLILHNRSFNSIFSALFLIGMVFEPMYLSLISSFQKEAAPLMIFNLLLMIVLNNKKWYPLIILLTIGVLLGHHFLSLYVGLLFITIIVYDYLEYLRNNRRFSLNLKILLIITIVVLLYQYVVGFRFTSEFEYYRFSQSDVLIMLGFYVLTFSLVYGRRNTVVRKTTQLLVFVIIILGYVSIRYLGVFGFNLPRPSIIELIVVTGYLALIFNSLRIKDIGLDKTLIPAIALALYGITLEPIYGGVTVLVKALRRIIPMLSLQAAIRPLKIASILFLIAMFLAFFAHIEGYTVFGGPALYRRSEVDDAQTIVILVNDNSIRCSWRIEVLLKYYNPSIKTTGLFKYDSNSILVLSNYDIARGLMTRVWYQYITVNAISKGRDLIYNSGVFYVYR